MPWTVGRIRAIYENTPQHSDVLAEVVQQRTAWPWLCDTLGHVNNARYFDILQDGRVEWLVQNGLMRPLVRRRMSFLVAGVGGVYRHSIPRMAPFVLRTRVASFDARWLYFEQTFTQEQAGNAQVAARFLMRVMLRARKGPLSPHAGLARLGASLPEEPPHPPLDLEVWSQAQQACLDQMR